MNLQAAGLLVGDNFDVRVDVKTQTSRGEYRLILEQWPRVYGKHEVFTRAGWRRWADLKPLVEGGTGLILRVEKHPAVDTARDDVERFSNELGIPVVANDKQCE